MLVSKSRPRSARDTVPTVNATRARPTTRSLAPKRGGQSAEVGGSSGLHPDAEEEAALAAYLAKIREGKRMHEVAPRAAAAVATPIVAPPSSPTTSTRVGSGRRAWKKFVPLTGAVALELASQLPQAESFGMSCTCPEDNDNQFCTMMYVDHASPWISIVAVSVIIIAVLASALLFYSAPRVRSFVNRRVRPVADDTTVATPPTTCAQSESSDSDGNDPPAPLVEAWAHRSATGRVISIKRLRSLCRCICIGHSGVGTIGPRLQPQR